MATKKVAGRVREHPPAVMFPENLAEPESHGVKYNAVTAIPAQTGTNRRYSFLSTALAFAAFGVGILGVLVIWQQLVVGLICVGAAMLALTWEGAR